MREARQTVLKAPKLTNGLPPACTPPVPSWAGGVSFFNLDGKWDAEIECQLQIRNLSEHASEADLRALFAQSGDVLAVKIVRDPRTGTPRGYGFVTMSAQSEGDTAVSRLDGHPLLGHKIRVTLVKARALHADFFT